MVLSSPSHTEAIALLNLKSLLLTRNSSVLFMNPRYHAITTAFSSQIGTLDIVNHRVEDICLLSIRPDLSWFLSALCFVLCIVSDAFMVSQWPRIVIRTTTFDTEGEGDSYDSPKEMRFKD
ncbi:hypothetical protein L2E82_47903 [Cichorium intybus]|uniref:Uncharacterized protein n=1 Tax=Cichorium intybus TaxID=13427 RepID=A0ACB8YW14_CICIN|nr:hypothetical protein L2E82_47903 [Cichorium intybus]